jgi:hypothetical protein
MDYLKKRLREPSSYAGLAALVMGIGQLGKINEAPAIADGIGQVGQAVAGGADPMIALFTIGAGLVASLLK